MTLTGRYHSCTLYFDRDQAETGFGTFTQIVVHRRVDFRETVLQVIELDHPPDPLHPPHDRCRVRHYLVPRSLSPLGFGQILIR